MKQRKNRKIHIKVVCVCVCVLRLIRVFVFFGSVKRRCRVPVEAGPSGPRPIAAAGNGGRAQEAAGVRGLWERKEGAGERPEQFCSAQSKFCYTRRSQTNAFSHLGFQLRLASPDTQWYAICLSDVGDYEGVKVKIGNSYIIRDHLEVSLNAQCKLHFELLASLTSRPRV